MCVICESTLNSSCASEKEACALMSQMCFSVDVCLCVWLWFQMNVTLLLSRPSSYAYGTLCQILPQLFHMISLI